MCHEEGFKGGPPSETHESRLSNPLSWAPPRFQVPAFKSPFVRRLQSGIRCTDRRTSIGIGIRS